MGMRIGLLILDGQGTIDLFSTAAEQMLGFSAHEVKGRPCEEILVGLKKHLLSVNTDLPDSQTEVLFRVTARHKNGAEIPVVVTPHVLPSTENSSADPRIVLILQDARDLDAAESRLDHLNRLQSIDMFTAGLVHEIRNPLAVISTNAQYVMEQMGKAAPIREEMQDILQGVKEIEDIVGKVLDFAGSGRLQVRNASLEDILREVLKYCQSPLYSRGIRLQTNLNGSETPVRVDVAQMKQVFFNIIRNAYEMMPRGGELRVSATPPTQRKGTIRVEVEDTGPGIPAELLERIFEPFFTTHPNGTGLGLAISRKTVEKHGGRIEVESTPGKGTKFTIVLPGV